MAIRETLRQEIFRLSEEDRMELLESLVQNTPRPN